ncbi:hypothetical protein GOARA_036_00580 [Gordonia araii NBRC 100433]|uniref:Transmembrane protein n=1 Tax=Gordonia araii NBRC 100433 TaxID=1073574 RepID=G7H0F1_9ACTN|nr:hypothetical protein [Gordonia araii]NNG96910.1 hypothetical protein [Gordonia araii NBRC 100433]GAB09326.1 hypothetical protein GOARA_036_00580 [Gordonia araii NBRC 100433]
MSSDSTQPSGGFEQFEEDLRKAEKKVAGEIDPGARALVVAVAVLVAVVSLALPHTGSVNGFDVLSFNDAAQKAQIIITSRVFVYLLLIFGVLLSALALVTRRWTLAWIALCGCMVSVVAGMLAWWSRTTAGINAIPGPDGQLLPPPGGVGVGLILGLLAMIVLSFHWARVVWSRNEYQLAIESQRREAAAREEERMRGLTDSPRRDRTDSD